MSFLKTLLIQYMKVHYGIYCKRLEGAKDVHKKPHPQESEDAFKRYYDPSIPVPSRNKKLCIFRFRSLKKGAIFF